MFSNDVLRYDEQAIMRLRTLYRSYGYSQYRMSRFEEYSLYSENKAFLPSGDVVTFTGAGGKLMALRPDVTLSIVKNAKDGGGLKKLYYNENVYRSDGSEFRERMQVGLECIGDLDLNTIGEVIMLALRSLETLGGRSCVDVSHMGFISGLMQGEDLSPAKKTELLKRVSEKNIPELNSLCAGYDLSENFSERITALTELYGPYSETIAELRSLSVNKETDEALAELEGVYGVLQNLGSSRNVNIDFSIVNDLNYYNGIIFQGFIEGVPSKALSGGRYDELLRKFGKRSGAIGFAVYLDLLESAGSYAEAAEPCAEAANPSASAENPSASANNPSANAECSYKEMINIALPKGRLGEKAYAIFEASGYGCPGIFEESRRLVFENPENGVRFFWVKPADVSIYVERGVADIGVAGKDTLLEYSPDVYELLDLGIGKCRMCVAAKNGFDPDAQDRALRVATKFSSVARGHYARQGREIDIIKLNGSIELAPLLGLSDVIVDIVETGGTLRENDLTPIETIVDISARLISNKASYKFNHGAISSMCEKIAERL